MENSEIFKTMKRQWEDSNTLDVGWMPKNFVSDCSAASRAHMSHDLGVVTIFRFSEFGLGLGLG